MYFPCVFPSIRDTHEFSKGPEQLRPPRNSDTTCLRHSTRRFTLMAGTGLSTEVEMTIIASESTAIAATTSSLSTDRSKRPNRSPRISGLVVSLMSMMSRRLDTPLGRGMHPEA